MTRNEAVIIIKTENLKHYNWFNDHNIYPSEVSITLRDNVWGVFTSDERACRISEISYDNESDALLDFIERLRADKMLDNLYCD